METDNATELLKYNVIIKISDMKKDFINYDAVQAFDVRVVYRRMPLHYHNMHEFFFCSDGGGEQLVEGGIEPMSAGELFFFPAGDGHRGSGSRDRDCVGMVVNAGDELLAGTEKGHNDFRHIMLMLKEYVREHGHCLPLTDTGGRLIEEVMREMVQEFQNRLPGYNGALQSLYMRLLLVILRHGVFSGVGAGETTADKNRLRMEFARSYLENNSSHRITVEELCGRLGMSRSYFHAEFLRYHGCTMLQHLNRIRCKNAIKMLKDSDLTPAEIAAYAGFGSVCSFYRTLRLETGTVPSDYRRG